MATGSSPNRRQWPSGSDLRPATGDTALGGRPQIREILGDLYADDLALPTSWDAARRAAFLEANTAIIAHRVAELAAELDTAAVAAWVRRHGAQPDHLTRDALLNTARESAMDIVLLTGSPGSRLVPDGTSTDHLPDV